MKLADIVNDPLHPLRPRHDEHIVIIGVPSPTEAECRFIAEQLQATFHEHKFSKPDRISNRSWAVRLLTKADWAEREDMRLHAGYFRELFTEEQDASAYQAKSE